jgi:hypothetical protein
MVRLVTLTTVVGVLVMFEMAYPQKFDDTRVKKDCPGVIDKEILETVLSVMVTRIGQLDHEPDKSLLPLNSYTSALGEGVQARVIGTRIGAARTKLLIAITPRTVRSFFI